MTAQIKKNYSSKPVRQPELEGKVPLVNYKYLVVFLFSLFCLLLFKNISYPLLWNDESETVMNGQRIIEYGYPKMTDEKNNIFLPDDSTWIGYKRSYDANITIPWGSYYFAAIGVYIADHVSDIYLRTAIIRSTFAAMGLFGLIIFMFAIKGFFSDQKLFQKFLTAFIFIELFSVSLFLHMREARYYSLVIFIVACFFYVFIHYYYYRTYSLKKYFLLMTAVLFFSYQMNVVTFLACCLTLGMYEVITRLADIYRTYQKGKAEFSYYWTQIRTAFINLVPVFLSLAILFPFLMFFEVFSTSERAAHRYGYNFDLYIDHIKRIWYVFSTQEFLYMVLIVKVLHLIVWFNRSKHADMKAKKSEELSLDRLSFFYTLFFICFCMMISRLPFPIVWARYIIVLQPIMISILLFDVIIIFKHITDSQNIRTKSFCRVVFSVALVAVFSANAQAKIGYMKDYVYQLTHPLQGPLDYLIPAIRKNYVKTDTLILATNYEELSYIYYLDCKVILGYVNKNYMEDMKLQPDLIVFRKTWGHNPAPYNELIGRAKYKRLAFPVYDSNTNNIAELDFVMKHQFKTRLPANENEKSDIFIRVP